ncbi:MAG: sigma-54-dependent Fis family transcriptional regulator [Desulfobacterales bacterium]|nr:MAG: sigma-54-dependent Fis family transcriptional regulator [Desulfobacterales bacterium]
MSEILIIDDDYLMNDLLTKVVEKLGHAPTCALTLQEGLQRARTGNFDVVILDVRLPDGNGLEALPKIRAAESAPEVIILTGLGDPDGAELAVKNGAWDYIMKPSSIQNITLPLIRALEFHQEKKNKSTPVLLKRENIIGQSPQINAALERVAQAAASKANVLVLGETGTGKELFARAIHANSAIADQLFVVVDCAGIPETLVEDILFGHVRGAFTGADRSRMGQIQQAHGGVLFLDEVGELPSSGQKTFLRVIQERRFRPVSGKSEIEVDFRLIAATNRDLDQMVRAGRFRSDLLFRLRSLTLELPPLRDRTEDIKELIIYYTNKLCERYGIETKGFSPEFFQNLREYSWPGNVRELFNALEEVLSAARHAPTLFPYHLPIHIRAKMVRDAVRATTVEQEACSEGNPLDHVDDHNFPEIKQYKRSMECLYLQKLMRVSGGRKKKACEISGLSRTRLFELLKKHEITTDDKT